mmetsp:Transcript_21655/g.67219  ORF Transcript_21655/g.67219 Transcript_21655/m.67219 type:complete len:202 (-) Transcript_21655:1660-2265(-)
MHCEFTHVHDDGQVVSVENDGHVTGWHGVSAVLLKAHFSGSAMQASSVGLPLHLAGTHALPTVWQPDGHDAAVPKHFLVHTSVFHLHVASLPHAELQRAPQCDGTHALAEYDHEQNSSPKASLVQVAIVVRSLHNGIVVFPCSATLPNVSCGLHRPKMACDDTSLSVSDTIGLPAGSAVCRSFIAAMLSSVWVGVGRSATP